MKIRSEEKLLKAAGAMRLNDVLRPLDCEILTENMAWRPGEETRPYNEQGTERQADPDFVSSYTSYGEGWMRRMVSNRILDCQPAIEARLGKELELHPELHFLTYPIGGYIKPHKDALDNEEALDKLKERLVVFSLFLNDDYEGGKFMVKAGGFPFPPLVIDTKPGDLVAFVSHLTHQVTTITAGTRYSVTGWFHGRREEE